METTLDVKALWRTLGTRNRQPEWMDQPDLAANLHHQALTGLARINWLSGSSGLLWPRLHGLQTQLGRPPRVLDIACGGGDVTLAIAERAKERGEPWRIDGCDLSPTALQLAEQRANERGLAVQFFQLDVLRHDLPHDYDVVMCSLFLHHLQEADAVNLLHRMGNAARHLVLVNDLIRSRAGFLLAVVVCRLLTRSRVVRLDGPLSVVGAFTPNEAVAIARQAGWTDVRVSRHWPFRFVLEWRKP